MKTSDQTTRARREQEDRNPLPDFYLPAMWPLGLQRFIADWIWAWRWRRRLRRLLAQEALGQARLGSARQEVKRGAELPLRVIVARNVARRGPCA
jgi:hypothetical protein